MFRQMDVRRLAAHKGVGRETWFEAVNAVQQKPRRAYHCAAFSAFSTRRIGTNSLVLSLASELCHAAGSRICAALSVRGMSGLAKTDAQYLRL